MYEVFFLQEPPDGSRTHIVEKILRKMCGFETIFNDYTRGCDNRCYEQLPLHELCEQCRRCMALVAKTLTAPDSIAWEVWDTSGEVPEVVGIIYVTDVVLGEDATGHYVFFDRDLRGKTGVLREVIEWLFSDHEKSGWVALRRLTIEVPEFAHALARHAQRKLGFGGPFNADGIHVEGVKRKRIPWRGARKDLYILGLENSQVA